MSLDNVVDTPNDKSVDKLIYKATLTSALVDAFSKLDVMYDLYSIQEVFLAISFPNMVSDILHVTSSHYALQLWDRNLKQVTLIMHLPHIEMLTLDLQVY